MGSRAHYRKHAFFASPKLYKVCFNSMLALPERDPITLGRKGCMRSNRNVVSNAQRLSISKEAIAWQMHLHDTGVALTNKAGRSCKYLGSPPCPRDVLLTMWRCVL